MLNVVTTLQQRLDNVRERRCHNVGNRRRHNSHFRPCHNVVTTLSQRRCASWALSLSIPPKNIRKPENQPKKEITT